MIAAMFALEIALTLFAIVAFIVWLPPRDSESTHQLIDRKIREIQAERERRYLEEKWLK